MKCPECRQAELVSRRENHRYIESGLPNVVLLDVEIRHCPKCGADLVAIPRMAQLHREIAAVLISKRGRLTPAEIRYLRKSLGWSGVDFARALHVDPSTVSRWESDKNPQTMEDGYELALRLAVAFDEQIEEYEVGKLGDIAKGDAKPVRIEMRVGKNGWQAEAAA